MSIVFWVVFTLLALSQAYIIYAFAKRGDGVFIRTVLIAFIPFTAYIILIAAFRLRIPEPVLIFAMISLFTHTFFGYFLRLYGRTRTFDRIGHAIGSFSYALLAYCTLAAIFGAQSPKITGAVFVAALGVMLGVFVEIMEFAGDSCRYAKVRLQKGLRDTNFDLIADVIGAAGAAVYAFFYIL